ncbi:putative cytokinetic ring protein SteA [Salibacterium lacus]|uniref:Cytokinetic ring protein SteA n=1 Tax=Salibacterium lacus TaxID=1898109 RepID=A0ABW5SXQ5_9BACI
MDKWTGRAKYHERTKQLVKTITPGDIAVLSHEDIDASAADSLIHAKAGAVLNMKASMSGSIPQDGVQRLLEGNIPVFDIQTKGVGPCLHERDIEIIENRLFLPYSGRFLEMAVLTRYTGKRLVDLQRQAEAKREHLLASFIENSLACAQNELTSFLEHWHDWGSGSSLSGRDVCIVIRGADYMKDLEYAKKNILPADMCRIAVDGAADGMREIGLCPDYIIGDMDSVSRESLQCGARLFVHQGPRGKTPGFDQINRCNLEAETIRFIGLSEDAAAAFALKEGASRIYMVGGHRDMEEYCCKGRKGMGSSLLMRMLAGSRFIDLKGIHHAGRSRYDKWWKINEKWRSRYRFPIKGKAAFRRVEGGSSKS